jgi:hypothetical protein
MTARALATKLRRLENLAKMPRSAAALSTGRRSSRRRKKAGVKRYYVEQDTTERPPMEAIKISHDYLHDLNV